MVSVLIAAVSVLMKASLRENLLNKGNENSCHQLGRIVMGYERSRDECFGLPRGGSIFGILLGLIIILWGLGSIFGWNIDYGPIFIVIIGALIVAGAIYGLSRRR